MDPPNRLLSLDKQRDVIARKVRLLRKKRGWTQAELARQLDLSQSRLSEIESGAGSFTAEQFLEILKLFNVAASEFATAPASGESDLQNALARLGALHLQESTDVVPDDRFTNPGDALREAIASGQPRLVTALAPVLARNIDRINLPHLYAELAQGGLGGRLGWLIENTSDAIARESPRATGPWRPLYRRAELVLDTFLGFLHTLPRPPEGALDVLDPGIRSKQTLEDVKASSSLISRHWGIITTLKPEDFVKALRGARAARA